MYRTMAFLIWALASGTLSKLQLLTMLHSTCVCSRTWIVDEWVWCLPSGASSGLAMQRAFILLEGGCQAWAEDANKARAYSKWRCRIAVFEIHIKCLNKSLYEPFPEIRF